MADRVWAIVRKYRPVTVSTTLPFVFGAPERRDEDTGMGKTKKALKPYLLMKRYVAQNRGAWDSSFVAVDTYQTFADAKMAMFGLDLKKLAKSYKPKSGSTLTEIRLEIYRESQKGEKRIRSRVFALMPEKKNNQET